MVECLLNEKPMFQQTCYEKESWITLFSFSFSPLRWFWIFIHLFIRGYYFLVSISINSILVIRFQIVGCQNFLRVNSSSLISHVENLLIFLRKLSRWEKGIQGAIKSMCPSCGSLAKFYLEILIIRIFRIRRWTTVLRISKILVLCLLSTSERRAQKLN